MMRNQKMMERASLDLAPLNSYADGLPVYFLTGKSFLYQTLFCIRSLVNHSSEKFNFILVDDGTFDDSLIARISRQLPGATVVIKAMIDQNLDKHLPLSSFPVLRKKREEYPHIKKLTDVHTIGNASWKLVLDSDMLFFNYPALLIGWLKNPAQPLHMIDCEESYGYSHGLMAKLAGNDIPAKINVGTIGLNSGALNWADIENWVKALEQEEGRSYYLEQGLSAMLLAGKDCTVLQEDEYIVNPISEMITTGTGVLHHYVDLSKKGYYNEAWRKVI